MTFDLDLAKISERPPRHTHTPKIMPIGPSAAAGEAKTNGRKESSEGRKARKYIKMAIAARYYHKPVFSES